MANRMRQSNKKDHYVVHCLQCHEPQEFLSSHLLTQCMKHNTRNERRAELQRAEDSMMNWTTQARSWEYSKLCELIADEASRKAMVQALLARGCFVANAPRDAEQPSTSAAEDASSTEESSAEASPEPPTQEPSLAEQQARFYDMFPCNTPILMEFKTYLTDYIKVPDYQQTVDTVSRVLRYIQPTGADIDMSFLTKYNKLLDHTTALNQAHVLPVTRLYYMTSLVRFAQFLHRRSNQDPELQLQCHDYIEWINSFRQHIFTAQHRARHRILDAGYYGASVHVGVCQKILRDAKTDMLATLENLQDDKRVSEEHKTLLRYYCEAILVLGHFQTPGAVEGMTALQWLNKSHVCGRVCVCLGQHSAPTTQIALTTEESAMLEAYYLYVRPDFGDGEFFIGPTGEAIRSVEDDIACLHAHYELPNITSQDVRASVKGEAMAMLSKEQIGWLVNYMADSPLAANDPNRIKTQEGFVVIADMLSSLALYSCAVPVMRPGQRGQKRRRHRANEDNGKDYAQFLEMFPVTVNGKAPDKRRRVDAGFSERTCFYNKWKAAQLGQREAHLLSKFCRGSPTIKEVKKKLNRELWPTNHPRPKDIVAKWVPAKKCDIEKDDDIMSLIQTQTWSGVAVKDNGENRRQGLVATRPFAKGSILCDFHGELITAEEGNKILETATDGTRGLFFFSGGDGRQLCVDARTDPCPCHPSAEAVGRKMKHSRKKPNIKPLRCTMRFSEGEQDVILLVAARDIAADEELRFNHGTNRKSFCGEGLDLDWVDERLG